MRTQIQSSGRPSRIRTLADHGAEPSSSPRQQHCRLRRCGQAKPWYVSNFGLRNSSFYMNSYLLSYYDARCRSRHAPSALSFLSVAGCRAARSGGPRAARQTDPAPRGPAGLTGDPLHASFSPRQRTANPFPACLQLDRTRSIVSSTKPVLICLPNHPFSTL